MINLFRELNKREEENKTNKKLTLFEAYDLLEQTVNNMWDEVYKKKCDPSHIVELELPPILYLLETKTIFSSGSTGFDELNAYEMFEIQFREYKSFLEINEQYFSYEEKMYFIEDFGAYVDKVEIYTEEEREDHAKFLKEMEAENKFLEKYQGQYIPTR